MTEDGLPHLIAARYVCIDEVVAEDHAQITELRAFNNPNRL
jgi:hypothetical protein